MKRLGTAHRCTDRLPLATDALLKTVWECDCGARWICTDSRLTAESETGVPRWGLFGGFVDPDPVMQEEP